MLDPRHVFANPDHFLYAFDGRDAVFIEMDRDAYHRSIFTDRRISPKTGNIQKLAWAPLLAEADARGAPAPVCYIFHIAHCGSTLLARALDMKEANLVCREPPPLRQLGVEAAGAGKPADWRERTRLARALLGRRYIADGPVIVKANVPVNFMIAPLTAPQPQQPAIFLYYPLAEYLLAILRSPMHRAWLENVSRELHAGLNAVAGPLAPGQGFGAAAARLWLAQMLAYQDALGALPHAASLDAETLFNHPQRAVAASFKHFGQSVSEADVGAIVSSDLFSRYSKDPSQSFDNARRLEQQSQLRRALARELDAARAWVERHPARRALAPKLAKPLTGEGPDLL